MPDSNGSEVVWKLVSAIAVIVVIFVLFMLAFPDFRALFPDWMQIK